MAVRDEARRGVNGARRGARTAARGAVGSPAFEVLVRLGYVVRGLLYGVIGVLALKVALGSSGRFADPQGAIAAVGTTQWGHILLYIILAGLLGYGLLGLIRAFVYSPSTASDPKGLAERIGFAASGISYLLLGYATMNLIRGTGAAARNGAQGQQLQHTTGMILSKPWGPFVVGLLGFVVILVGAAQIVRAGRRDFNRQFRPFVLDARHTRSLDRIGRFGMAARGVVFALIGVFLVQAAYFHDPKRAQGIDGVLASFLHQPYGVYLLAVVALGLIAFAIYSALAGLWLRLPRSA